MTSMQLIEGAQPKPEVLKVDVVGRVKTPRERREEIVDAFEKSGLSGARFARQHGIKYQTFASWVQKRRRERGGAEPKRSKRSKKASTLSLAEVEISCQSASRGALRVELPGGAIIVLNDLAQTPMAAELLRHLSPATSKC